MNVLIATSSFAQFNREPLDMLAARGLQVKMNPLGRPLTEAEVVQMAGDCVGVIAGTEPYTRHNLGRLNCLRVISRCGVGLDGIDLEEAGRLGITVTCTPEAPTEAVAELTLGLILSLVRHIGSANLQIRKGQWRKQMGFLLGEVCVGIIGLGRIGRRVAGLLRAWNVRVIGYDIEPDFRWAQSNGVSIVEKDALLGQSDVLCLHLPYSSEIRHLIGEDEIGMMKPGSFLVNTARGGLVDESALYRALESGHLGGAALDTFDKEPYEGPLQRLDNVILTPHIGSYARAGRIKMEMEATRNLLMELVKLGGDRGRERRRMEAEE